MAGIRLGLIGDNIASSRAPDLHRMGGRLCGLDVGYERLVPPARGLDFEEVFTRCALDGFRGINVTLPYKERAAALVTVADPHVRAIGAVNTVLFEPTGPQGFNTDYTGCKAALAGALGELPAGPVCLVGAGGVGKAIAFALVDLGLEELRLIERDLPKAAALAEALCAARPTLRLLVTADVAAGTDGAAGIVNATPVGMEGYPGTPVPAALLRRAAWAFDAVYTPLETTLLGNAAAAGLRTVSGYELFFYQGLHAFEIFCGRRLDEAALRAALLAAAAPPMR